jgi:glutamine amidotransferase
MSKVVIIDYELGNLFSVRQALENIGLNVVISKDLLELKTADAAILPGVGAFADAMKNLNILGLADGIHEHIACGKPFMGVCLGLQLLFTESEEFGNCKGLNVFPGIVKRFNNFDAAGNLVRVPQISWNEIYAGHVDWEKTPLKSLEQNEHMYFVHSFYVEPTEKEYILSYTQYHHKEYTSSVHKNNIFACQFHPEKSAGKGLSIYKNWATQNNLI